MTTTWAGRTWLITGGSTGIGRALAAHVLAAGGQVVVTARDVGRIDLELAGRGAALRLDLERPDTFPALVAAAQEVVGPIDVLVNNAGYGLLGAIEETSRAEALRQLQVNFLGPAELTRLMLPMLRDRGSGSVVNISSMSGVVGPPGSGYYAASKFAVEGWSDALRAELKPFGVRVLVVEPGPTRTDFFGRSRHTTALELGVYDVVDGRRGESATDVGRQPGDPERGAAAIVAALDAERPPARLILGEGAAKVIKRSLDFRLKELHAWIDTSVASDFPAENNET
jgi:NAD(P)-dependent dehydrogenase (short-subunit alcohol dehydrogenase family)